MKGEDIDYWIKTVIENKINSKNTWNSALISYFKDLNFFKDEKGFNFQKASIVLDGCVKVFSLRVEDIGESTKKLMKLLFKEGEAQENTKQVKKYSDFLVNTINLNTINMHLDTVEGFHDSVLQSILSEEKKFFICEKIKMHKEGMFLYDFKGSEKEFSYDGDSDIHLSEFSEEIQINELLPLCKGLDKMEGQFDEYTTKRIKTESGDKLEFSLFKPEDTLMNASSPLELLDVVENKIFMPEENNSANNDGLDEVELEPINFDQGNYKSSNDLNNYSQVISSPFEYFEEKEVIKENKDISDKKTEPEFKIDFNIKKDKKKLFKKGNVKLSKKELDVFKNRKNLLNYDFDVKQEELFELCIDKTLNFMPNKASCIEQENISNSNLSKNSQDLNIENQTIQERSIRRSLSLNFSNPLTNSNANESFRMVKTKPIVQKKIDINKLKNTLLVCLKERESYTVKELRESIVSKYSNANEANEISMHYCFICALHLANENELRIVNDEKGVLISAL